MNRDQVKITVIRSTGGTQLVEALLMAPDIAAHRHEVQAILLTPAQFEDLRQQIEALSAASTGSKPAKSKRKK